MGKLDMAGLVDHDDHDDEGVIGARGKMGAGTLPGDRERERRSHQTRLGEDAGAHRRIVLTGFMGAGKTTVGRLLAPLLGWQFQDADAVLTERADATVAELFARHGEPHFRALEAQTIAELLSIKQTVIALGGGAVEHEQTRLLLSTAPNTLVVYLETPLHISMERCALEAGAAMRPVLSDRTALEERFESRLPLYRAAHLTIATEGLRPEQIAGQIYAAVRR